MIYIHTHDTGRLIGPCGSKADTPNLDRLARSGTVLRKLFCAGPTCSPSRSALLTGTMPHSNGMFGLAHRGFSLENMDRHLCRYLKGNSYFTALFGMQHEAADPASIGYDHMDICQAPEAANLTAWDNYHAGAVCDFLDNAPQQPFFLSYGLAQTHRPFLEKDSDFNPDYLSPPDSLPDVPVTRADNAAFLTSIRRADAAIGRVLDKIRQLGLERNSVIFFTTDHGPAFPFMKCNLNDSGIGVAGIISFPGNPLAGSASDVLLSQLDFFPTLCDILDLEKPDWLQGRSFYRIFSADDSPVDRINSAIYAEITYHAAYEPMRCIRTPAYKLIRRYPDLRPDSKQYGFAAGRIRLANIDESPSKEYLQANGLENYTLPGLALYDLVMDPHEKNNLADDERYAEIRQIMLSRLEKWQDETGDKLFTRGYVQAPAGAVVNSQTCSLPDSIDHQDYE